LVNDGILISANALTIFHLSENEIFLCKRTLILSAVALVINNSF
jgi:hypothetical protein